MIDKALALRAIETHGTIFFDIDLQPVVPQPGQWFCEFDDQYLPEDSETLRDEAIVEYLGPCEAQVFSQEHAAFIPYGDPKRRHRVATEYSESDRRPNGVILVRQS